MRGTTRWTVAMAVTMAWAGWASGGEAPRSVVPHADAGALAPAQALARGGLQASFVRPSSAGGVALLQVWGGRPHEALILRMQGPAGPIVGPLLLDGTGRWERRLNGLELDADVQVRFLRPSGRGVPELAAATSLQKRERAIGVRPHQGSVVVTEVMKDPQAVSDSQGEWIEVVNTSAAVVDLEGWTLSDLGSNSHTITNGGLGVLLNPGQRFVLGNQDDPTLNGGVNVEYRYSGFSLSNGADEVILRDASGLLVDVVAYDDGVLWPDTPGAALNLHAWKENSVLNDDPANWCDASSPIGPSNPDLGTPGGMNSMCP